MIVPAAHYVALAREIAGDWINEGAPMTDDDPDRPTDPWKVCPRCGVQWAPEETHCPECGRKFEEGA